MLGVTIAVRFDSDYYVVETEANVATVADTFGPYGAKGCLLVGDDTVVGCELLWRHDNATVVTDVIEFLAEFVGAVVWMSLFGSGIDGVFHVCLFIWRLLVRW
jgi:hypothetical protein